MLKAYQNLLDGELEYRGDHASQIKDPIGIGAVGGSGTRVLLQIMAASGVAMAAPINQAGDAIEWPPLKQLLDDPRLAELPRERLLPAILGVFEGLLARRRDTLNMTGRAGWKVPETFHWLAELSQFFPDFQYVHLVRHGLDMAYSGNQNQVEKWAPRLNLDIDYDQRGKISPRSKLEYWLRANEQTLRVAGQYLPGRMLVVRFEDLCNAPGPELERILAFLDLHPAQTDREALARVVKQPRSVGRYRRHDWRNEFSASQLARLAALGYPDP